MNHDISLISLLTRTLKCWKLIIILSIIITFCLLGAKQLFHFNEEFNNSNEQEIKMIKQQNIIEKLEAELVSCEDYLENSLLLKLDPYNYCVTQSTMYIDSKYTLLPELSVQNIDKIQTIVQTYLLYLNNDTMYTSIIQNLGLDTTPKYLRELVTLVYNETSRMLQIEVKGENNELNGRIIKKIQEEVHLLTPKVIDLVGDHTVREVAILNTTRVDLSAANPKITAEEQLTQKRDELKQAEFLLTTLQPSEVNFGTNELVLFVFIVFVALTLSVMGTIIIIIFYNKVFDYNDVESIGGLKVLINL